MTWFLLDDFLGALVTLLSRNCLKDGCVILSDINLLKYGFSLQFSAILLYMSPQASFCNSVGKSVGNFSTINLSNAAAWLIRHNTEPEIQNSFIVNIHNGVIPLSKLMFN